MNVLGIETSCDECAASVVVDGKTILSNVIATQIDEHRIYYGVVPELASRIHTEWIAPTVKAAVEDAGVEIDAVAVTNRPGLLGSLLVGVSFAKGYAAANKIPLIGIDHIRAHLYAPQIEEELAYPYLGVLVSGGHTVICKVTGYDELEVLGTTIDDAIGEAFDKVAKHYDLGYPGGIAIDRLAQEGDPLAFRFPGPKIREKTNPYDISYSGLKSAAINHLDKYWDGKSEKSNENIAASFQRSAINMLIKRIRAALADTGLTRISVGGGVAANSYLRSELMQFRKGGYEVAFPSMQLCTDNAAMIAALAYHYLKDGIQDGYDMKASARVSAFKKQYTPGG